MSRKRTQQQTVLTPASESDEALALLASDPALAPTPPEAKAPAAPKQTPAERRAAREAKEREAQARGEVVRNAAGRPTARHLPCLCGCGAPTHRDDAWFLSGHDARLRKNVILNGLGFSALPEIVRPFFLLRDPIAGLLLDEDGETLLDVKAGGGGLSEHHEFA